MIGLFLRSGLTTLIVAAYLFVVGLPLVWRNYSASPTPIPLDLVALEQGRGVRDRHVSIGKHMGYHRSATAKGGYVLFVVGGLPKEAQSIKQSVDAPPTEMARARLILRKPKREWDAKVGDGKRWLREGDTGFISGTAKEMLSPRVRSFMERGLGVPSVDGFLVLESGQRPNLIPGTTAVVLAVVLLIFGLYSCVCTVAEITGRSKPLPIAAQDITALLHVTIALIGFAYISGQENSRRLLEMSLVYVPVICFVVSVILGAIRLLTYFFRTGRQRIRERPRFGIRGMLVAVALAGVVSLVISLYWNGVGKRRWEANVVRRLGGQFGNPEPDGRYIAYFRDVPRFGNNELAQIARLSSPAPWGINAAGTSVTNDGLQCLAHGSTVRLLDFSRTAISDEGIRHVAKLEALKQLYLDRTPVSLKRADLTKLSSLMLLHLIDTPVQDEGLAAIAQCSQLRDLSLLRTQISDGGLRHLQKLAVLERLNLGGTKITSEGLSQLAHLAELRRLDLRDLPIDDGGLRHLAGLRSLKDLSLKGTNIDGSGLAYLSELTNLEVLDLRNTKVSSESCQHLARLSKLQRLSLSDTSIDGAALRHLARLKSLTFLELAGCNIQGADLQVFADFPSLDHLDLGRIDLGMIKTDAGAKEEPAVLLLKDVPSLRSIRMRSTGLTPPELDRVKEKMSKIRIDAQR